jgi:hypothetical protein
MSLEYEAGVARLELARVLPPADPEHQRLLDDAARILSRMGSTIHLETPSPSPQV